MKVEDGQPRWSATDLSTFGAYHHASLLDREVAHGRLMRPHYDDPAKQLLNKRGRQHEARYLALLEKKHLGRAHRCQHGPLKSNTEWQAATEKTRAAMQAGHAVVFQAALAHSPWTGLAGFLIRVDHNGGNASKDCKASTPSNPPSSATKTTKSSTPSSLKRRASAPG